MKKLVTLLVFLIIFSVGVMAQPFQQTSPNTDVELEVVVPKNEYFQQNQPATLHFHVYNATGILMTNTTTDCYIHIYNMSGSHVTEMEMRFDSNLEEWAQSINASEHTHTIGFVPYIVWCNNTAGQGGFFSGSIEVNTRTQINGNPNIWGLALVLLGCLAFFITLASLMKGDKWFHTSIRLLLILLSIWLMVLLANLGVSYVVEHNFTNAISTTMTTAYMVCVYAGWIFTFLLVIYFVYELFMAFRIEKTKKDDELLGR